MLLLANKGFANLAIVTKFSPLPEPCDNGKTTTCGSVTVYRAKSVNGEVDGSGRAPVNFLKESFADEETCRD